MTIVSQTQYYNHMKQLIEIDIQQDICHFIDIHFDKINAVFNSLSGQSHRQHNA